MPTLAHLPHHQFCRTHHPLRAAQAVLAVSLLIPFSLFAAVDYLDLPASRFVEWKRATIDFPTSSWTTVDVSTLGIHPGNTLHDSIAKKFVAALAKKPSSGVIYHFPAGTYTFEAPICIGPDGYKDNWNVSGADVNNVIIAGDGPDKTRFLFDCDVNYFKALIWIEKPSGYSARNSSSSLSSVPQVGSNQITLPSGAPRVSVGDLVDIKSDNDPALMFPAQDASLPWYRKYFDPSDTLEGNYPVDFAESYGQISRVTAVNGSAVTIDPPVLVPFKPALDPRVSVYAAKNRIENIGVRDLYVEHIVADSRYRAMGVNDIFDIAFRFVKNGFVSNVESRRTARGHVMVEYSHNVLITGSRFTYSRAYGVGGAGYGVCIQNRSSDVTVENNEFRHLRHSIVLKEGACRNIIAYNWSYDWAIRDPSVTDTAGQPISAEADISIHGMYSHHNLIEGNVCFNIVYADYWGPTGPKTTAFRNRCKGTDSVCGIRVHDFSHSANVIANQIAAVGGLVLDTSCKDLYVEGNVVGGTAHWSTLTSTSRLPPSLYLMQAPGFWPATMPFPAFGPDVPGSEDNGIPVEQPTNPSRAHHDRRGESAVNAVPIRRENRGPVALFDCTGRLVSYRVESGLFGNMPGRAGTLPAGVRFAVSGERRIPATLVEFRGTFSHKRSTAKGN